MQDGIELPGLKVHFKSCEEMGELVEGEVDVIVTSPPYYNAKGTETWPSYEVFLDFLNTVLKECYRVLREGRVCCVNVCDYLEKGVKFPIPADTISMARKVGFKYEDDIIWMKPDGMQTLASCNRAGNFLKYGFPLYYKPDNRYEHIIILRKGKLDYDEYRKIMEGQVLCENSKSRHRTFRNYLTDVWYIPTVPATKENRHPLEYPEELVEHLLAFYSIEGETVLDPFLGSGTTAKVAQMMHRKCVGYEINPDITMKVKASKSDQIIEYPSYRDLISKRVKSKDRRLTEF